MAHWILLWALWQKYLIYLESAYAVVCIYIKCWVPCQVRFCTEHGEHFFWWYETRCLILSSKSPMTWPAKPFESGEYLLSFCSLTQFAFKWEKISANLSLLCDWNGWISNKHCIGKKLFHTFICSCSAHSTGQVCLWYILILVEPFLFLVSIALAWWYFHDLFKQWIYMSFWGEVLFLT